MKRQGIETLSHDVLIRRLRAAARAVPLRAAAEGFIASLVDGPPRYVAPLGHLAFASNLPEHAFSPNAGSMSYKCAICGANREEEIDRDECEASLAGGGFSLPKLGAALVDLEGFAKLPPVKPTARDLACFDAILGAIDGLPPEGRVIDLIKKLRLPKSNVSNAHDREWIFQTLGACGIFDAQGYVGHLTRWIGFWEYEEVPRDGDMRPPEAWWKRADGVSREALDLVFPFDGINRDRFALRPILRRPFEEAVIAVPKKGPQPAMKLSPGDVVGFGYESRWVVGIVLGAHKGPKRAHPVFEFYADAFSERPNAKDLVKAAPRLVGPYREAPHARREPVALEGMEFLGGVMGVKVERIGEAQPAITSRAVVSPYRVVATRNLLYLMKTLASPFTELRTKG